MAVVLLMLPQTSTLVAANEEEDRGVMALKIDHNLWSKLTPSSDCQTSSKDTTLKVGARNFVQVIEDSVEFPRTEVEKVALKFYPQEGGIPPEKNINDARDASNNGDILEQLKEPQETAQKMYNSSKSRNISCNRPSGKNNKEKKYDIRNHYMKKSEFGDEILTSVLVVHAERLSAQASNDRITICCVALINKENYVEKFIFNNGAKNLSRTLRDEAEKLGYDVIQTDDGHAEVGFLIFLINSQNGDSDAECSYTHIAGMACDKAICDECDVLLRLALGENYRRIVRCTGKKIVKQVEDIKFQEQNPRRDDGTRCYDQNIVRTGTIYSGEYASDSVVRKQSCVSDRFYIPADIKAWIVERIGAEIDVSHARYTKS